MSSSTTSHLPALAGRVLRTTSPGNPARFHAPGEIVCDVDYQGPQLPVRGDWPQAPGDDVARGWDWLTKNGPQPHTYPIEAASGDGRRNALVRFGKDYQDLPLMRSLHPADGGDLVGARAGAALRLAAGSLSGVHQARAHNLVVRMLRASVPSGLDAAGPLSGGEVAALLQAALEYRHREACAVDHEFRLGQQWPVQAPMASMRACRVVRGRSIFTATHALDEYRGQHGTVTPSVRDTQGRLGGRRWVIAPVRCEDGRHWIITIFDRVAMALYIRDPGLPGDGADDRATRAQAIAQQWALFWDVLGYPFGFDYVSVAAAQGTGPATAAIDGVSWALTFLHGGVPHGPVPTLTDIGPVDLRTPPSDRPPVGAPAADAVFNGALLNGTWLDELAPRERNKTQFGMWLAVLLVWLGYRSIHPGAAPGQSTIAGASAILHRMQREIATLHSTPQAAGPKDPAAASTGPRVPPLSFLTTRGGPQFATARGATVPRFGDHAAAQAAVSSWTHIQRLPPAFDLYGTSDHTDPTVAWPPSRAVLGPFDFSVTFVGRRRQANPGTDAYELLFDAVVRTDDYTSHRTQVVVPEADVIGHAGDVAPREQPALRSPLRSSPNFGRYSSVLGQDSGSDQGSGSDQEFFTPGNPIRRAGGEDAGVDSQANPDSDQTTRDRQGATGPSPGDGRAPTQPSRSSPKRLISFSSSESDRGSKRSRSNPNTATGEEGGEGIIAEGSRTPRPAQSSSPGIYDGDPVGNGMVYLGGQAVTREAYQSHARYTTPEDQTW